MRISIKRVLAGAAIALFVTQIFCPQTAMAEGELRRPNNIFFLVDDLGWPIPLHELQNTAFVDL